MTDRPRIALIHATRVAIDPVEMAAAQLWPKAETISILEEGLSVDRSKHPGLTADLSRRIADLCRYAVAMGADGVLFTCSAFGEAIERAGQEATVPVMKPNEAMFDAAFAYGDKVAMIYTFPPAAAGMEEEFRQAAKSKRNNATITSVFCDDALEAKRAGDGVTHDKLIADCAAAIEDADVILMAQFSMASAAEAARKRARVPVLTSPEAAVEEMRRRVEGVGNGTLC